jgi:hypothetical protein
MSSGFIQNKSQIVKLALDRKLFNLYKTYLSYYDHSNILCDVSYNIASAKNLSNSLEIFLEFMEKYPSEKTIKQVLQNSMYISIEKNNREIFHGLIVGRYQHSNLYFVEIKNDILGFALKICKQGKIISDIISNYPVKKDAISVIELEIDKGTDIYLGGYHELMFMIFTMGIYSKKIYRYLLLKCTEISMENCEREINGKEKYEIMRMLLNDVRWKCT